MACYKDNMRTLICLQRDLVPQCCIAYFCIDCKNGLKRRMFLKHFSTEIKIVSLALPKRFFPARYDAWQACVPYRSVPPCGPTEESAVREQRAHLEASGG